MDPFNQETRNNIETALLSFLREKGKTERKNLFVPAYEALRVTQEDIKDNVPSGNYSKAKSYIGMIVSELVSDGRIQIDAENRLSAVGVAPAAIPPMADPEPQKAAKKLEKKAKPAAAAPAVVPAAPEPEPAPIPKKAEEKDETSDKARANKIRKALTEKILTFYLTPQEAKDTDPDSLAGVLRSLTGAILKNRTELWGFSEEAVLEAIKGDLDKTKVVKEKILNRRADAAPAAEGPAVAAKAAPATEPVKPKPAKPKKPAIPEPVLVGPVFPIASIDRLIRETFVKHAQCVAGKLTKETYDKHLIAAISHLFGEGEEFFETFSFMLIKKLYGTAILKEHYAPGPDDEGVDGEFVVEDGAGFKERVMMQAKTKKNDKPSISMKILREYVGVMHIRQADKCIIISNSSITKDAREQAKKLANVMLIGDKELFELMKKTRFGITIEEGVEKIDLPALVDLIGGK